VSTSNDDGFVWFDDVRVFLRDWQLMCAVDGKVVPLPVLLLIPTARLQVTATWDAWAFRGSGRRTAGS